MTRRARARTSDLVVNLTCFGYRESRLFDSVGAVRADARRGIDGESPVGGAVMGVCGVWCVCDNQRDVCVCVCVVVFVGKTKRRVRRDAAGTNGETRARPPVVRSSIRVYIYTTA